jgi:hypothetical protein
MAEQQPIIQPQQQRIVAREQQQIVAQEQPVSAPMAEQQSIIHPQQMPDGLITPAAAFALCDMSRSSSLTNLS